MTYDVERVVLGGGVSRRPADLRRARSGASSTGSRAARRSPRELLPAGMVESLPPSADAGAWGGVTIARDRRRATPARAGSAGPPLRHEGGGGRTRPRP